MEGIIVVAVIFLLLILLLPSFIAGSRNREVLEGIRRIEGEMKVLKLELLRKTEVNGNQHNEEESKPGVTTLKPSKEPITDDKTAHEPMESEPALEDLTTIEPVEPEPVELPIFQDIVPTFRPMETPALQAESTEPHPNLAPKPPRDWEKFIGENLINKIGIAILTLGIGVFVKYAIDKDWINEIGRVVIGFLAAALLLGFAHYLRKTYEAFSSVLVGGAIATMYFTVGIAFHEYHIFSQIQAFGIMILITAFSVFISMAYNRMELAVIAQTGGFITPFIVSTGQGNYVVLFSYLLVLNIGLLVLAWHRKWNLVYTISYLFTLLIYGGWLLQKFEIKNTAGALLFGSAFYILFSAAATVFTIRRNEKFKAVEYLILLSLNMAFFLAGLYILNKIENGLYSGLFTAALATVNFIAAYVLFKKDTLDKNFIYLLIGLVLSYVTLVAPIQLHGNKITLFWAAEMVILMYLFTKTNLPLLRWASLLIWPLLIVSLLQDWTKYSIQQDFTPLLNRYFVSGIFTVIAMFLYLRLQAKYRDDTNHTMRQCMLAICVLIAYITGLLEVQHAFGSKELDQLNEPLSMGIIPDLIYSLCFIFGVHWASNVKTNHAYSAVAGISLGLACLAFVFFGNKDIIAMRNALLPPSENGTLGYLFHYVLLPLFVLNFIFVLKNMRQFIPAHLHLGYWFTVFFAITFISMETDHFVAFMQKNTIDVNASLNFAHRAIYPLVWGISAFVIMFLGLKYKTRVLRIISLALFAAILLKLFIIDLRYIGQGGRILAFISLGIILLVVSFLYQKLKLLLTKDALPDEEKS